MGFEVSGLVRDKGVTGGMRLIEGILCKGLPVAPNLFTDLPAIAIAGAAFQELFLQPVHHILLLFPHSLAQRIGLAGREACHGLRQLHHLFLVDGDAIGVLQVLLHHGQLEMHFLNPVLAVNITGDIFHGARPVQRVHRYQVLKTVGFELPQVAFHTHALKLEQTCGLTPAVQVIGGLIIQRQPADINIDPPRLPDIRHRILDDRKGFEPEEIHFEHAHAFDMVSIILGNQVRGVFRCTDGYMVDEAIPSDDHPAGMDTGMAHRSFQDLSILEGGGDQVIGRFSRLFQLGYFIIGMSEGDARAFRYKLGKPVGFSQRQLLYPTHITYGHFGGHGAEGDDLGHLVLTVFFNHPLEHLLTPVLIKIDINIGEGSPIGIEESFKQEVIFERVDIGDTGTVSHH